MALDSTNFLASFDITDKTQEYDISAILLAALMADTGLLGVVPMGSPATDTTHYWTEIALNTGKVTVAGAAASSASTTVALVTGQGARLRGGEYLKNLTNMPASGLPEVTQVIAIATDTITVTRALGGTTAVTETFQAAAVLDIIAAPLQEASDVQADATVLPSSSLNYTQIFERSIKISRNQMKRPMASIADMLVQSIHDRTMELKRELERSLWHGKKAASTPAGLDGVYRTMDGILAQVGMTSFNTVLSYSTGTSNFCQVIKTIVDNGAADDVSRLVLAGPTAIRQRVSGFDATNRRLVESDRRAGYYVEQVVSDLGVVVDVITSNYLGTVTPFTFAVLDVGRIKLVPFQDDAFKLMAAQDWVDGIKRRILGEFTVEVRNATTAHYAGYLAT